MKTYAFKATIIVEQEELDIQQALTELQKGEVNVMITDGFVQEPVIFLERKVDNNPPTWNDIAMENPKQFLYQITIAALKKIVDTPAQSGHPAGTDENGNQVLATNDIPEVSHVEYNESVDQINVVASDVPNALAKITLKENQLFGSVIRGAEVHAS